MIKNRESYLKTFFQFSKASFLPKVDIRFSEVPFRSLVNEDLFFPASLPSFLVCALFCFSWNRFCRSSRSWVCRPPRCSSAVPSWSTFSNASLTSSGWTRLPRLPRASSPAPPQPPTPRLLPPPPTPPHPPRVASAEPSSPSGVSSIDPEGTTPRAPHGLG